MSSSSGSRAAYLDASALYRRRKREDLRKLRFHDLRHTFGTTMVVARPGRRPVERLIIDAGRLIPIERGQTIPPETLPDDADIAIAAITASEPVVGVELPMASAKRPGNASVDAMPLATFDVDDSP